MKSETSLPGEDLNRKFAMPLTPDHIVERNRLNAVRSTGPTTERGKQVSRQNAVTHGLCANPASGVIEDPSEFKHLQDALDIRFCPRDPLEEGLVHRIAVCLWRLHRAAKIDGAISTLQTEAVRPGRERIHRWVTEITQSFAAIDWVEITDPELLRQRAIRKPATKGQQWFRAERRFLPRADRYRDEVLFSDGTAIQAMALLIRQLANELEYERLIEPAQAQLFAWLMGESAERLVGPEDAENRDACFYPDDRCYAAPIDYLIGEARKRPHGTPLPAALSTAIQARLADLEVRSRSAADPYSAEQEVLRKTEALLPDPGTLDRLIRYEGHAERSMLKAIETLSKLRGVTIESIRATMTRPGHNDVSGERTTWSGQ